MDLVRVRTIKDVEEDISRLEEWLCKQPHLPDRLDHELLYAFAHGTKSLEIAKKKLDSYLSASGKCPQLFGFPARDPLDEEFIEASKSALSYKATFSAPRQQMITKCEDPRTLPLNQPHLSSLADSRTVLIGRKMFVLPQKTKEGFSVFMVLFDKDISKFNNDQIMARSMMITELVLMSWPDTNGFIILVDQLNIDFTLLSKISSETTAFIFQWVQSSVPVKVKRTVMVNIPAFFYAFAKTFIKPFLSKKLFDRYVFTAEGKSAFKKYVDPELLPCDYGGKAKSSEELNDYWMEELIKNRDWFLKTSQLRVDESKRPPDEQDSFGTQGTFRSLAFD